MFSVGVLPLLAVKTFPRSHDVDVHASDLVGIDGITRVLIVHIPEQNVCPRGHILPPIIIIIIIITIIK
jgi:hypothetical protein